MISLDEAARRLGCHVETLRIRIRSGRLGAVRGPHGAYLVHPAALTALRFRKRGSEPPRPGAAERSQAWRKLADQVAAAGAGPFLVAVIEDLRRYPRQNRPAYRLLAAHSLHLAGLSHDQIGRELGVTARHARRLVRTNPLPVLHDAWLRRSRPGRLSRGQARDIVGQLRRGLSRREQSAPLLFRLTPTQRRLLGLAGLSEREIRAISLAGITAAELQELIRAG